jgi:thiamine biosynthesis protein ThiC
MKKTQIKNAKVTNVTNEKKVVIAKEKQSGESLKKQIEKSLLVTAKQDANKEFKQKITSIGFLLSEIKASNKVKIYLAELQNKYNCSIDVTTLNETTKQDICKFITDEEQIKRNLNPEKFSYWFVLTLIGRFHKANKVSKAK